MKVKRFTKMVGFLLAGVSCGYAITIGQGPALQNGPGSTTDKRGTTWYEEFQDWTASDIRALDANNDQYTFANSQDTARDSKRHEQFVCFRFRSVGWQDIRGY